MRILLLISIVWLWAAPALADGPYTFDKAHTSIRFAVTEFGVFEQTGSFSTYDGDFVFCQQHPDKNVISVTLLSAGISTPGGKRDEELRGEHFFNAAKFPSIRFASTKVKFLPDNDAEVTGNLTLLGVTKPVTLQVHFRKKKYDTQKGDYVASFTASTVIKRGDFGMNYMEPVVADDVRLHIDVTGTDDK